MLSTIKKFFIGGLSFGAGVTFFAALTILVAQSLKQFESGDLISATSINQNFTNLNTLATNAAPTGKISAFHLNTCPEGWIQADGNNGTPDLRGVFLRGMNSFDGGATSNARDPEDTGARSLTHYQTDQFASHTHELRTGPDTPPGTPQGVTHTPNPVNVVTNAWTNNSGGTETRPKNVAVIFCMKN